MFWDTTSIWHVDHVIMTCESIAPPTFFYNVPVQSNYLIGRRIPDIVPILTGGNKVEFFYMDTALPEGLELNAVTGVISGTPTGTTASELNTYTVVASNPGGYAFFALSFSIDLFFDQYCVKNYDRVTIDVGTKNAITDQLDDDLELCQTGLSCVSRNGKDRKWHVLLCLPILL
jgi:hypothetical protein